MLGGCVCKRWVSKKSYQVIGLAKHSNTLLWLQVTSLVCSYRKVAAWMNGKTDGLRFVTAIGACRENSVGLK